MTKITAKGGWRWINLAELWAHRELIRHLGMRDIKVRYKQTVLGAAWALLQPILLMVVFTMFMGRLGGLPSGDLPYPLFVFSGLLPWIFFATSVSSISDSVLRSERLISKVYFPRLAIPIASLATALADFGISFAAFLLLSIGYGHPLGWSAILALPILAAIVAMGLGVGTGLAALNVSYRDFRYVVPFLIQIWMFATPSIYMDLQRIADSGRMPGWSAWIVTHANPLIPLIAGFRSACLGQPIPWTGVAWASAAALAVLALSFLYYRKAEDEFADVI